MILFLSLSCTHIFHLITTCSCVLTALHDPIWAYVGILLPYFFLPNSKNNNYFNKEERNNSQTVVLSLTRILSSLSLASALAYVNIAIPSLVLYREYTECISKHGYITRHFKKASKQVKHLYFLLPQIIEFYFFLQ